MFAVGGVGYVHPDRRRHLPLLAEVDALLSVLQLHALGDPAVHPDGCAGRAGRPFARSVPGRRGGHRQPSRRDRHGGDRRLHRIRRHLRLVGRDDGDHGPGGAAGAAALWLRRGAGHRHARGRRHAGHPDPAVDHPGHLRDRDRAEHRQAVHGGAGAGPARGDVLHRRHRLAGAPQPGSRPGRARSCRAPSDAARWSGHGRCC